MLQKNGGEIFPENDGENTDVQMTLSTKHPGSPPLSTRCYQHELQLEEEQRYRTNSGNLFQRPDV